MKTCELLDRALWEKHQLRRDSEHEWQAIYNERLQWIGWVMTWIRRPDGKMMTCTAYVAGQIVTLQLFEGTCEWQVRPTPEGLEEVNA